MRHLGDPPFTSCIACSGELLVSCGSVVFVCDLPKTLGRNGRRLLLDAPFLNSGGHLLPSFPVLWKFRV